jgi:hypothetical protein
LTAKRGYNISKITLKFKGEGKVKVREEEKGGETRKRENKGTDWIPQFFRVKAVKGANDNLRDLHNK